MQPQVCAFPLAKLHRNCTKVLRKSSHSKPGCKRGALATHLGSTAPVSGRWLQQSHTSPPPLPRCPAHSCPAEGSPCKACLLPGYSGPQCFGQTRLAGPRWPGAPQATQKGSQRSLSPCWGCAAPAAARCHSFGLVASTLCLTAYSRHRRCSQPARSAGQRQP